MPSSSMSDWLAFGFVRAVVHVVQDAVAVDVRVALVAEAVAIGVDLGGIVGAGAVVLVVQHAVLIEVQARNEQMALVCWAFSAPGVAKAEYQVPVAISTLLGACGQKSVSGRRRCRADSSGCRGHDPGDRAGIVHVDVEDVVRAASQTTASRMLVAGSYRIRAFGPLFSVLPRMRSVFATLLEFWLITTNPRWLLPQSRIAVVRHREGREGEGPDGAVGGRPVAVLHRVADQVGPGRRDQFDEFVGVRAVAVGLHLVEHRHDARGRTRARREGVDVGRRDLRVFVLTAP